MSLNTFIWGFPNEYTKVVDNLVSKNVITPKCWITYLHRSQKRLFAEKSILDGKSFHGLKWLTKYNDLEASYDEGVKFNQDVYAKVYEKLHVFIDQNSRNDQKMQEKDVHDYLNQFNLLYNFFYSVFIKEEVPHQEVWVKFRGTGFAGRFFEAWARM